MRDRLIELIKNVPRNTKVFNDQFADYLLENGVIVLPAAIGVKVWCLAQPCGGCACYNEPMKEEFIEVCRNCDKREIIECDFDYDLIPEFGKTVFATREEALSKLQAINEQVKGGAE